MAATSSAAIEKQKKMFKQPVFKLSAITEADLRKWARAYGLREDDKNRDSLLAALVMSHDSFTSL